eukprot:scaffold114845_cov47-Prasinocladus_malaysianus.AAC.2
MLQERTKQQQMRHHSLQRPGCEHRDGWETDEIELFEWTRKYFVTEFRNNISQKLQFHMPPPTCSSKSNTQYRMKSEDSGAAEGEAKMQMLGCSCLRCVA